MRTMETFSERAVRTVLDEMILRQALQGAGACDALRHEQSGGDHDLFPLRLWPAVHVLEEVGQYGLFKRSLEILVPVDKV